MKVFEMVPGEILDYTRAWTDWLAGDTISNFTLILPSDLSQVSATNDNTSTTSFISAAAIVVKKRYVCTHKITTAGGRTASRSFVIKGVEYRG